MIIPSIGASEKPRLKNEASFHRGANVWIWSEYCRTTLNKIGKDQFKSRLYRFLFFSFLSCSKPFQISLLALFQILRPGHFCSWRFIMKTRQHVLVWSLFLTARSSVILVSSVRKSRPYLRQLNYLTRNITKSRVVFLMIEKGSRGRAVLVTEGFHWELREHICTKNS